MDTFLSHPHGFLKAVSGGSQRASGYAGRDTRGTGTMVTSFLPSWWGESAHLNVCNNRFFIQSEAP
jgi:hypothetical protein